MAAAAAKMQTQTAPQQPHVPSVSPVAPTGPGAAWPSWFPTMHADPDSAAADPHAFETDGRVDLGTTKSHFPPWRESLECALKNNEREDSHLYAALATIKAFGRPSNRGVYFRGFLSDGVDRDEHLPAEGNAEKCGSKHRNQIFQTPLSPVEIDRLSNILVFAIDVRSGSVEDLIHGSKFGEVCWIFPETREQFRLSGQLHLLVAPNHHLATTHQLPRPFASSTHFPQLEWETVRRDMWRRISAVRRASYTWPTTHHDTEHSSGTGFHRQHVHHTHKHQPDNHKPDAIKKVLVNGAIATDAQSSPEYLPIVTHIDDVSDVEAERPAVSAETLTEDAAAAAQKSRHAHHREVAFNNFCLLLLDVDGVDVLDMRRAPHVHKKYRRSIDALERTDAPAANDAHEAVVRVSLGDRLFSVDSLAEGGDAAQGADALVKKVANWSVRDVVGRH